MSGTVAGPCMILPNASLSIDLCSPFLHGLFGIEANDEILDTRVTLPEDLACVGS